MKMQTNHAAVVAINAKLNSVVIVGVQSSRSVEQARVAFVSRRLRIEPHLAAVIANAAFGELSR